MASMMKYMVVLQHGSHGTHLDLACLARYLRAKNPQLILWESYRNEGSRTDDGVIPCGERLADDLMNELLRLRSGILETNSDAEKIVVRLSFVCHSMGGLIVREALPRLWDKIELERGKLEVEWRMFCTVGTPHGGVQQMSSTIRYYLGWLISIFFSTSFRDMFLGSDVLSVRLLSKKHLSCLAAFERRLLVSSINDILVPLMSSGFMLLPSERGVTGNLGGAEQNKLSAFSKEEMYEKMRSISVISKSDWPTDKFTRERHIITALVEGAGPFDSVVVDLRRPELNNVYKDKKRRAMATYGAYKRSHQAMMCKPPFDTVEEAFNFVLHMIGDEVVATF